jgi:crotonobetainyl-CoA:carnitine CoA-transferase CaiB-like acyl-CoA transferase
MNSDNRLPYSGLRVVDCTNSWAGPYATQVLAVFGAQVIKVESIQYLDTWRGSATAMAAQQQLEKPWERSPLWNSVNAGKFGITLNLRHPRGVDLFKRLVKISDIVAENYTPRVMKQFGLDYPVLKEVKPDIIMISLPAYGGTGPWSDYVGFAAPIEQMSGLPQLTGYPDGPPKMSASGFTDPMAGMNGAVALTMALVHRQMTGHGQYIDLSQVEVTTSMIGDAIVEYTLNRRIPKRRGNRHTFAAPHGCYRCKGGDDWIDLAVYNDDEWRQFCQATGNPAWEKDPRFATSLERSWNQDELDRLIEGWTIQHDHYEVMHLLQKIGIVAGAVLSPPELLDDPHLKARHTYEVLERPVMGTHPYPIPSAAMRLDGMTPRLERPSPTMGQHNDYVLGEILGLSREEIIGLENEQVIGNRPIGL